jgi:hypothetical protein
VPPHGTSPFKLRRESEKSPDRDPDRRIRYRLKRGGGRVGVWEPLCSRAEVALECGPVGWPGQGNGSNLTLPENGRRPRRGDERRSPRAISVTDKIPSAPSVAVRCWLTLHGNSLLGFRGYRSLRIEPSMDLGVGRIRARVA